MDEYRHGSLELVLFELLEFLIELFLNLMVFVGDNGSSK